MAKLKVFISSTYYDLKHIRSSIEGFVEGLGYEAILSEKGSIAYNPDSPLDESCYRDAQACDIFVLILGGRYGSASSSEKDKPTKAFLDRYESITKKEFDSAMEKDIPIYILIDRAIYSEYETFKRNRKKNDVEYAHVDSINIFHFIDEILSKPRNNPVHQFDKHNEILEWLKLQWSGLFKDFLQRRNETRQISTLSEQVKYLAEFNTTLKRYLEEIISVVADTKEAKNLVSNESKRLEELEKDNELKMIPNIEALMRNDEISFERIKQKLIESEYMDDFIDFFLKESRMEYPGHTVETTIKWWKERGLNNNTEAINMARGILNLPPLKFRGET